ncbi:sulfotransferase family 2 domain-containing protein [Myxosarcina sp. GI1]|uniref:sulfotransferase family 2 domain-containing protein n=1 Tax=Myxosarcina sp. GI1 TaxID=1541065 RepID=UPI000569F7A3|nr:sulfotransferase family 2 domain-containing protein [Myxosarcina sp. GI1]
MNGTIIFTHIPKTSGTSFRKHSIDPNFDAREIYEGKGRLALITKLNKRKIKIIQGHIRFGIHRYIACRPIYITFFRDPIQRAISEYFFIKQSKYSTYTHPDHALVENLPLQDFFKLKYRDNLQTRFIAGYGYDKIIGNSEKLLDKAIENLDKCYKVIGIKERFDESLCCFQNYFDWKQVKDRDYLEKKTLVKSKIEDLDANVLESLHQSHVLDLKLYEYATAKFEQQLSNLKV